MKYLVLLGTLILFGCQEPQAEAQGKACHLIYREYSDTTFFLYECHVRPYGNRRTCYVVTASGRPQITCI